MITVVKNNIRYEIHQEGSVYLFLMYLNNELIQKNKMTKQALHIFLEGQERNKKTVQERQMEPWKMRRYKSIPKNEVIRTLQSESELE